ncbi:MULTISPECIES: hypothetical protein [Actinosynnema]|uniref:hypothetical protein n=1 Tax=Actinosynnema TaxID=40566 RepID=UPI0020A354A2|nr:hypothetical protein [Actinosynnema pretiosum]
MIDHSFERPDYAEVSGLVELALDDATALAHGTVDSVPARYAARDGQTLAYSKPVLARTGPAPSHLSLDQFHLPLFVVARRYCSGERVHLFR